MVLSRLTEEPDVQHICAASTAPSNITGAVAKASKLKPEIRLAQAVSEFEAILSSDQKAAFRSQKSQLQNSPPGPRDVMRLTSEVDKACGVAAGRRCFGPRLTNFLHAVQQFAALGDIVVGGSQNVVACSVWALVRMSLLVGILLILHRRILSNTEAVNCHLLLLPRQALNPLHEHWPLRSPLRKDDPALSTLNSIAVIPCGILHCSCRLLSSNMEICAETGPLQICIHSR